MLWTAFGLNVPAFAALALAMDRHRGPLFQQPLTVRRQQRLRGLALALWLATAALAARQGAPAQAFVEALLAASLAALAVTATLVALTSCSPRRRGEVTTGRRAP